MFVIAPATANVIAKLACGIADDLLTSAALAVRCPVIICPAMNVNMYENAATQKKSGYSQRARSGYHISSEGNLACGDVGKGRMAEPGDIVAAIKDTLNVSSSLAGKKFLVTAGGTMENIDGVRYITNRSSGKMGCAIVRELKRRGAAVTLVAANMKVPAPDADKVIRVVNAKDMLGACMAEYGTATA